MRDLLLKAVEKKIISVDQVGPLLEILTFESNEDKLHGKFDFSHLFWFVGVVLLIFAVVIFTIYIGNLFQENGFFITSLFYLTFLYYFSRRYYTSGLLFLSSLLLVSMILVFPISVGLFSEIYLNMNQNDIINLCLFSLLCVSSLFIVKRKFPLLIVGIYIGALGLFLRVFKIDLEQESFWLMVGWLTLFVSWMLNLKYKLNYSFWLNKFAVVELGYGVTEYVNIELGFIEVPFFALSIILLFVSVYLRYSSFVMTGITGILTYLNYLVFDVYNDLLIAAIIIAFQAIVIILAVNYVYKKRDKIDEFIEKKLPNFMSRLRPDQLKEPLSYGI